MKRNVRSTSGKSLLNAPPSAWIGPKAQINQMILSPFLTLILVAEPISKTSAWGQRRRNCDSSSTVRATRYTTRLPDTDFSNQIRSNACANRVAGPNTTQTSDNDTLAHGQPTRRLFVHRQNWPPSPGKRSRSDDSLQSDTAPKILPRVDPDPQDFLLTNAPNSSEPLKID
jgi:hypothetical protein